MNVSASTSSSTSKKKVVTPISNTKTVEAGHSSAAKHEKLEVTVIPVNEDPYPK